jgi:hypothetical protein
MLVKDETDVDAALHLRRCRERLAQLDGPQLSAAADLLDAVTHCDADSILALAAAMKRQRKVQPRLRQPVLTVLP